MRADRQVPSTIQDVFDLKIHTGDSFLDIIVNYYLYLALHDFR